MSADAVRRCLLRDLEALGAELDAYPDDASVWSKPAGYSNAAGTLVLHCCGNLRHFVGATLGNSGYQRNRDAEFSTRDVSRADLHAIIEATCDEVDAALRALPPAEMDHPFPLPIDGNVVPTGRFLVHLAVHLTYHLGQMDGHRRIVTGEARPVGAVSAAALIDHQL